MKRPNDMSPTATGLAIHAMNITGQVIPAEWFIRLRMPSGIPDTAAILVLSEIVYWYRLNEIGDAAERTVRLERKFYGDKLQLYYNAFASKFGISVDSAKKAVYRLIEFGVITRELRTVEIGGAPVGNVPFWDINVEKLAEITFPYPHTVVPLRSGGSKVTVTQPQAHGQVAAYTKSTQEITQESTTDHDHGDERATSGTSQAAASEASSVMAAVQAPTPSCAAPLPAATAVAAEHTIVASTATVTPEPAPYVPMKEAMARAQAVIDAAVKETTPYVVLPPVDPQIAALTKILTEVGVGVNSYTFDLYRDLAVEHGMPAVIAGIKIAAENGKQQSFKYVSACVVNAAKGTTNVSHKHAATTGQAVNASGSGSGQGAGENAGRKPRRELDPAKVALFSGRSL